MTTVSIRDLVHHFAKYLKVVKAGKKIIVLERNVPIADIIPHNENVTQPGWRREVEKIKIEGEALSHTVIKSRREETR